MRNELPAKVHQDECGIINLDDKENLGTHWTAYKKCGKEAVYFDSFGNLRPPLELVAYLKSNGDCRIVYNHKMMQSYDTEECGHLCLSFLYS